MKILFTFLGTVFLNFASEKGEGFLKRDRHCKVAPIQQTFTTICANDYQLAVYEVDNSKLFEKALIDA